MDGKEINQSKLSDLEALLVEKVGNLDLTDLSKYGGSYFIWGIIPESGKIVMKQHIASNDAWKFLLNSMNALLIKASQGKLELALKEREEEI